MNNLDSALSKLKKAILSRDIKTQNIIIDWINKWSNYIIKETTFKSECMPYFKRGDIVYIEFGFNIGVEYGGIHYAVVIESNNNKKSGSIVVVPLTSYDPSNTAKKISKHDILLGYGIIPWTDPNHATVAKPNQIRAISKIRIVKPIKKDDKVAKLSGEQLNMIDQKIDEIIKKH
ncbi:MAG: type II toxin-antitoxin system PemK/MazF family toxin [Clostridia bacterium]|nr:type II toxin-antitoxin system PemK/MazF family toxin [Clostridia bacterium]